MTQKELQELKERSDADLARTRSEPEYAEVLADVCAEVHAADLTRSRLERVSDENPAIAQAVI